MKYKSFIIDSLKTTSLIANQNFGKTISHLKGKDNNQVLTQTDLEIGEFLIKAIEKNFFGHNIIDEEAGVKNKNSEYTWIIDPIDGTSNFAAGSPLFGTMIGLLKNNAPIAGGISLPSFNKIYFAEEKCGAYCNGQKIKVTNEPKLSNVLLAYNIDGHQEDPEKTIKECKKLPALILNIRNLRVSGCDAFDGALLSEGKYGASLNQTEKIWDNVAKQIIVEEAGGIFTDFWGRPVDYSGHLNRSEENFTHCAAPKLLHDQIQKLINVN